MSRQGWLVLALALSLLVNVAALGFGVRMWQQTHRSFPALQGMTGTVTLPRQVRSDLASALAQNRDTVLPALKMVHQARVAAVQAATAQPFDRAKLESALTDLRLAVDKLMVAAQAVVVQRLAERSATTGG